MVFPRVRQALHSLAWRPGSGYTIGMKTAISLPDELFEQAEHLAGRLKVSRSELYAKALQDFVRRHSPDAITDAYDQICADTEPNPDPFLRRVARKSFKRIDW